MNRDKDDKKIPKTKIRGDRKELKPTSKTASKPPKRFKDMTSAEYNAYISSRGGGAI